MTITTDLSGWTAPDLLSRPFLVGQMRRLMDFFLTHASDTRGGFAESLDLTGRVREGQVRSLVNAARHVIAFTVAYRHTGEVRYGEAAVRGGDFLQAQFKHPDTGHYAWRIGLGEKPMRDDTLRAYGLTFVVQALSRLEAARLGNAHDEMLAAEALLSRVFWQDEYQLYADELEANGQLSAYRGQNVNMHAVEASLALFDATDDVKWLSRAETIASRILRDLASQAGELIWEHYGEDWRIDWTYGQRPGAQSLEARADKYRPAGFQPGHFAEWAKLLLVLDEHLPRAWHLWSASALFAQLTHSWDASVGGFPYALSADLCVCDPARHYWVHTEAAAAAALLYKATRSDSYLSWYEKIWRYCARTFIDEHGAWRALARAHGKAAVSTGYHILVCCEDALRRGSTCSPGLPAAGEADRNRP